MSDPALVSHLRYRSRRQRRLAFIAILNVVLPGAGLLFAGRWVTGATVLVAALVMLAMALCEPFLWRAYPVFVILVVMTGDRMEDRGQRR